MSTDPSVAGPRAVFANRDFRLYQAARLLLTLGMQMQAVAVGLHVYSLTGRALDLGFVGLAQFLPVVLLSPLTGDTADRFDRRRILLVCYATLSGCALLLHLLTRAHVPSLALLYGVLVLLGVARAFLGPAGQSLVPSLVPHTQLATALAWSSSVLEVAVIAGPALGGMAYGAVGPQGVYLTCAALMAVATLLIGRMRARLGRREQGGRSWERLVAGLRFVWHQKVVLGALSLDLFAVLLGGAVALLPVFAKEVLDVGPRGMGLLRSAPAVGAAVMALVLAHRPLRRNAGRTLLLCVALFGVATLTFGLSRHLLLSLVALAVLGAADMVSVVVRSTLVQLATPEEMRGRVSAVNMVFIGASNELGEFESGLTAHWLGAVQAVVVGGVGTLCVVALWAWRFPELRRIHRLEDVRPAAAQVEAETAQRATGL